jgi:hypothetical protein
VDKRSYVSDLFNNNNININNNNITDLLEISYTNKNMDTINRKKLYNTLFQMTLIYGFPIESIFLTFALIEKMSTNEYIKYGLIIYFLVIKLVCNMELSLEYLLSIILEDLNFIIIEVLSILEWNIDIHNEINYIYYFKNKLKLQYIMILIIIFYDDKYYDLCSYIIFCAIMRLLNKQKSKNNKKNKKYKKNKNKKKKKKQINKILLKSLIMDIVNSVKNYMILPECKMIQKYAENLMFNDFDLWINKLIY